MELPKRVRRDGQVWPTPQETNNQIADLVYSGNVSRGWNPTSSLDQAAEAAREVARKNGWKFELKWRGEPTIEGWEARFYRHRVLGDFFAYADTPAAAVCRAILNVMDGVREEEYERV
jgi:hypothetical protein